MTSKFNLTLLSGVAAAAVTMMAAGTANATFGMLPHCVGTVKCGMGGAGSGRGVAAVDASVNPAVSSQMGNEYQVNVGAFKANVTGRTSTTTYDNAGNATNAGRVQGPVQSSDGTFPNGSLGVNYALGDGKTFNLSIVPGGGGASNWARSRTADAGQTTNDQEITYEMVYIQPSMAFKVSDTATYGVGAILSRATMKTDSIYGNFTATANPNSKSTFWGVGFQVGGVWKTSETGSMALNVRSPVWHQDTGTNYNNTVFVSPIDTPMQVTAGMEFEAIDKLTVAMDYKYVNWKATETIGTPAWSLAQNTYAGFGWDNQHIFMVGMEYAVDDATNVRAGYSHGNSPITENNVFANFLFPAIVEDHFTVGADTDIGNGMNVGFSAYVTPEASVVDTGAGTAYSQMGAGTSLRHQQYGFQVSFSNEF